MRVLLIYPNLDSPVGVNHGLTIISGVLEAAAAMVQRPGHDARTVEVAADDGGHVRAEAAEEDDARTRALAQPVGDAASVGQFEGLMIHAQFIATGVGLAPDT